MLARVLRLLLVALALGAVAAAWWLGTWLGLGPGAVGPVAAMLFFVHGRSSETFDLNHRPLFLRFNAVDREERRSAFRDLCAAIGVDPDPYVGSVDRST